MCVCCLCCFYISQIASAQTSAQTYTLEFHSPAASSTTEGYSAEATVDGFFDTGWSSTVPGASITWDIDIGPNQILPTLDPNQYYVYKIYLGWTNNWRNDLQSYQLSTRTASDTSFSLATNFESLISSATAGNTLSLDDNGVIDSTQPSIFSSNNRHTLHLAIDDPIESLKLTALAQGWESQPFILTECNGIVQVMTVPEPSAYALLLGLVTCVAIAYKKRINQ
ncbi:MAG: hypothetical protein O2827_01335 [Verrucomicrobia bacterium]|nr:hypothetical protein [Verrucomicrobiota bacterium]